MFKRGMARPKGAGRKKGSRNKATVEFVEFLRGVFESEDYREALKDRLIRGKASKCEELCLHYVHGKPKETHEVTGKDGGPLAVQFYIPVNNR
jgi:hypothetical protein